jgi:hypothetical protein
LNPRVWVNGGTSKVVGSATIRARRRANCTRDILSRRGC